MSSIPESLRRYQRRVEVALEHHLPHQQVEPARLHQAMRYACLNGGKRIRAMLVYATGEYLGTALDKLDTPAAAVEMIHAYSLIHDDLPAMDNDDLRRGQPTCHRAFDEATALLAGDSLQARAYEILATSSSNEIPNTRLEMLQTLTQAAGSRGMCAGQAIDLSAVGQILSMEELKNMHMLKTGALIRASVALGALSGLSIDQNLKDQLDNFAKHLGLTFQIVDDILDEEADTATLGKKTGADRALNKPTFTTVLGLAKAKEAAEQTYANALACLDKLGDNAGTLRQLAELVAKRIY
ncbi:polyprenyl synthetase family protein [Pseudomonadota bacterium]